MASSSTPKPPGRQHIAICGMALRLPGGIHTTQQYWDLLINGRDARTEFDGKRFSTHGFDDALGNDLSIRHQNGYFLHEDLSFFDTSFFSLSRKEAERCDPQQRLLLEVTRECLEDAGQVDYAGRTIGCYVGSFGSTWLRLQSTDPLFPTNYSMSGMEDCMLANRISYEYDFVGPSMTINTACSASLVALNQAVTALQDGAIEGAVVAGACLQLSPAFTEMMAREGTLSRDGSSKSFDARADGFARAEGITAVYIKRLDDAIQHGDPIRAVIRACGSNSGGNRAGLMQPGAKAQEMLMRTVYDRAGLDPAQTAFVELTRQCHGTGTYVGDPIETSAVDRVFGDHGVYIGSVKPNIGHTEGSAGLSSLIKAVLALEHGVIPPNIKLNDPNPKIPFERLTVPTVPTPFPGDKALRVSINSFGIGGANAHAIVDAFQPDHKLQDRNGIKTEDSTVSGTGQQLVLFSANTVHSLERQAEEYTNLASRSSDSIEDIAYTRALRREHLPYRAFGIFDTDRQLLMRSDISKPTNLKMVPRLVMTFSGQGSQWVGMGKELIHASQNFRNDIADMDRTLTELPRAPDWSISSMLLAEGDTTDASLAGRFNSAELSQPLCTALQIALVNELGRLGINPDAVVGHSSGEIAAAYAAGYISMQFAMQVAYYRGLVTKEADKKFGGMAAVGMGAEEVIRHLTDGVVVACENSPISTTISGNRGKLSEILASINRASPETFTRMLKVDMAYHSQQMELLAPTYLQLLQKLPTAAPSKRLVKNVIYISSVTGATATADEVRRPEYWVQNLTHPVLFSTAIETCPGFKFTQLNMFETPMMIHLEIGPHATLGGPLRQMYGKSESLIYVSTQKRGSNGQTAMLEAIGRLYQLGVKIDFRPLVANGKAIADLPPYPWDHTGPSLWHESRVSIATRFRSYPRHYLLGLRSPESSSTHPVWRNIIDTNDMPWLLNHRVLEKPVFPFTGYITLAGEAVRQVCGLGQQSGYRLHHVVASAALFLGEQSVELMTLLRPRRLTDTENSPCWFEFEIQSYNTQSATWIKHCAGEVRAIQAKTSSHRTSSNLASEPSVAISESRNSAPPAFSAEDPGQTDTRSLEPSPGQDHGRTAAPPLPRHVSRKRFYDATARNGLRYTSSFSLLTQITASATHNTAHARLKALDQHVVGIPWALHPTQMDNFLQLIFVAQTRGLCRDIVQLYVPTVVEHVEVMIGNLSLSREHQEHALQCQVTIPDGDLERCQITGWTLAGQEVFLLKGVRLARLETGDMGRSVGRHGLARLEWLPTFDIAASLHSLKGPPYHPHHLETEQRLTFLCMLEQADAIRHLRPSKRHLRKMQDWLTVELQAALDTGSFPLVANPRELASLESNGRQNMIRKHTQVLQTGPYAAWGRACSLLCDKAPAVFAEELEVIDLLIGDNLLADMYNQNSFEYGELVSTLAVSNPKLRILEVGAGTGGTTEPILQHLQEDRLNHGGETVSAPWHARYTFSDISAAFFAKAQARFDKYDGANLDYRVLDISQSPAEQGFEAEEYHIIIAANVVHATPSLRQTLTHLRYLLRPGGLLVLTEALPTLKTVNYVFGHFSGWWLGDDDGRRDGPLVTEDRWDTELKAAGFSGTTTVAYGGSDKIDEHRQLMTIISLAESSTKRLDETEDSNITLLAQTPDSLSTTAETLKEELERHGWSVHVHGIHDTGSPPSAHVLISCVDLEDKDFRLAYMSNEAEFESRKQLMKQIAEKDTKVLWLMPPVQLGSSKDIHAAQLLGFSRTLRSELNLQIFTLEISPDNLKHNVNHVDRLLGKVLRGDLASETTELAPDFEYAIQNDQLLIPRFRNITLGGERARLGEQLKVGSQLMTQLRIREHGSLEGLYWQHKHRHGMIPEKHMEVEIHAVGLNALDIYSAKGLVRPGNSPDRFNFGCEASGIISRIGPDVRDFQVGDRVVFFSDGGSLASHDMIPAAQAIKIPDSVSFEQAATIPVCFGTAMHGLCGLANVQRGQSVLIHSACGGVGLAALQICQMVGAEMFLTVGNERKVEHLVEMYGVSRDHIFSSRDDSFVEGIRRITKGVGVDVVLNSLSGELLHTSWSCVAPFGCLVELGVRDSNGMGKLNMTPFGENRSYHGLEGIHFTQRPAVWTRWMDMFFKLADEGSLRPLDPLVTFPSSQVPQAFAFLEDPNHIGKVVVTMVGVETHQLDVLTPAPILTLSAEGSYFLTGGVGGLGIAAATWLVERGARHLTFLSRSSGVNETSRHLFDELGAMGCSVTAVAGRADCKEDVEEAVRKSKGPVKGVLHLAMVLDDAPLLQMSWAQWQRVMAPKAEGAWNLHSVLQSQGITPDFFFVASSIVGVLDATGQANYVAANAVNQAFCRYRLSLGLPTSLLNICLVEDVGYVATNEHAAKTVAAQGFRGVVESDFLDCLELSLLECESQRGSSQLLDTHLASHQHIMGLQVDQDLNDPKSRVMWRRDRRMGFYHNIPKASASTTQNESGASQQIQALLVQNGDQILQNQEALDLLATEIGRKIKEYLLRPHDKIDPQSSLADLGLDSLLSVELARWFSSVWGVHIGVLEIIGSNTLRQLAINAAGRKLSSMSRITEA